MKLIPLLVLVPLAASLALSAPPNHAAQNGSSGRVDFGVFTPPASGGEFVEVNIGSAVISMAATLVEKQEPEVARLVSGLRSIKVAVIGIDDGNRVELENRAKAVTRQLLDRGWERIVSVQKQGQDVGVFLKTRTKEVVEGLTLVMLEGTKQAVFINVDGDIKPEQLALIGERFHLEPLKEVCPPRPNKEAEAPGQS